MHTASSASVQALVTTDGTAGISSMRVRDAWIRATAEDIARRIAAVRSVAPVLGAAPASAVAKEGHEPALTSFALARPEESDGIKHDRCSGKDAPAWQAPGGHDDAWGSEGAAIKEVGQRPAQARRSGNDTIPGQAWRDLSSAQLFFSNRAGYRPALPPASLHVHLGVLRRFPGTRLQVITP